MMSGCMRISVVCFFFFNDTATTEIYTLSLHDALPIWFQFGAVWICITLMNSENFVNNLKRCLVSLILMISFRVLGGLSAFSQDEIFLRSKHCSIVKWLQLGVISMQQ